MSKSGVSGAYSREVGMLKGSIERERQDLQLLERRVEEQAKRQQLLAEEVHSVDALLSNKTYEHDIQYHGLKSEIEEYIKENKRLQSEKEYPQLNL